MFLHRIYLNPRSKEARRDLADPYQFHSTLCRAFSPPGRKCPESQFLWRLEPEIDALGCPRILVQSRVLPEWGNITAKGWLAKADPPIDLKKRLGVEALSTGRRYRFRLRANPCVRRNGKRIGLMRSEDQESWIRRQGMQHGFALPKLESFDFSASPVGRVDVRISQSQMLRGRQHSGNRISIFSVLYDGVLATTDPNKFRSALQTGIGHGKAMGLGLLSVAPVA